MPGGGAVGTVMHGFTGGQVVNAADGAVKEELGCSWMVCEAPVSEGPGKLCLTIWAK